MSNERSARGDAGQEALAADSAESTAADTPIADATITAQDGSAAIVGQAAAVVTVARPAPRQTVEIQASAGQVYDLDFAPATAQVRLEGGNFILSFDDDGDGVPDSQIVFLDLVSVSAEEGAPVFTVAGTAVASDVLVGQAQVLAGTGEVPLDTAAGQPGAAGTGATEYNDDVGSLLELLTAQDVIGAVVGDLEALGILEAPGVPEELIFPPPPFLINEIGVGVGMALG